MPAAPSSPASAPTAVAAAAPARRPVRLTLRRLVAGGLPPLLLALLALGWTACGGLGEVTEVFEGPSPYEAYSESLRSASLDTTPMGRAWFEAGREALTGAEDTELPFREAVYFDPAIPTAFGWRLNLERGHRLVVTVSGEGEPVAASDGAAGPTSQGRTFVGLYRLSSSPRTPSEVPDEVARSENGRGLDWQVERSGVYGLRLQMELLAGGRREVTVEARPSLTFPVQGAAVGDIGSRFGDPRDGGARSHQGVDIFAPRGTAAVAAADGRVVRVGTNRLGGNVVWMVTDEGLRLYYAHLDRQLVSTGARVSAGEPVGEVGTSGNARTTPPHLHFSVHEGAAVDPWPYLVGDPGTPQPVTAGTGLFAARWARVAGERMNLRSGPSTTTAIRATLARHTPLALRSARGGWYRVRLVDGTEGWAFADLVEGVDRPLASRQLPTGGQLRYGPEPTAPLVAEVEAGGSVEILAVTGDARLVTDPKTARRGWLDPRAL